MVWRRNRMIAYTNLHKAMPPAYAGFKIIDDHKVKTGPVAGAGQQITDRLNALAGRTANGYRDINSHASLLLLENSKTANPMEIYQKTGGRINGGNNVFETCKICIFETCSYPVSGRYSGFLIGDYLSEGMVGVC